MSGDPANCIPMRALMIALVAFAGPNLFAQDLTPNLLRDSLKNPPADLANRVRDWFGKEIATGANAKIAGLDVVWAIDAPGAKEVLVRNDLGGLFGSDGSSMADPKLVGSISLARIGDSDVFVHVATLRDKAAYRWQFEVDGKPVGPVRNLEVYTPNPYFTPDSAAPKGKTTQMPVWKSRVFEGTTRDWWIYVPPGNSAEKPACLTVVQDGKWSHRYYPVVLDNMIARGEIPPMVAVFLDPGTKADGGSNRSFEYDTLSDQYTRFLLGEIIPEVRKVAALREGPENWAISGVSSGGICAFTAAWQRPDKFGKVMSWVGSFTNIAGGQSGIAGGHNYPAMIRRSDPKPIRVFLQDGSNDLDNQFGNWFLANLEMASAFKFKKYDFRIETGSGFHSEMHGQSIMGDALKWLWRDVR